MLRRRRWWSAPLAVLAALALIGPDAAAATGWRPGGLPLGPRDLPEQRAVTRLAPGLTLTTVTRGRPDPATQFWTIAVNMPLGEVPPDPDPDADQGALGTLAKAQEVAAQISAHPAVAAALAARGWQPRVEPVDYVEPLVDYPGGLIGYTLRIGQFTTRPTTADPVYAALVAANFKVFAVHTGQDGRPDSTGPWVVRYLTVDPWTFRGTIRTSVGEYVSGRETTSDIARAAGALYAVNGGFFTINPADGTPGVPAGLTVLDGEPVTAATNGRVALILGDNGRDTRVAQLSSRYQIRFRPRPGGWPAGHGHRPALQGHQPAFHGPQAGRWFTVDGLNRPPGVIRNCGGVGGDHPTQRPAMDFTCTDPDELVVLTPRFGAESPTGAGVEAVVDAAGRVLTIRPRTGQPVPAGASVVQATGTAASWLAATAVPGSTMSVETTTVDSYGRAVRLGRGDSVVNGGPQLLSHGRLAVDPEQDGLLHESPALGLPDSALGASFGYNWFVRNHPRTGVGVDRHGRLLIVQADGRQERHSQGLTIAEFATVMHALGAVDAINLDGGGSSATVVDGTLISSPSDTDGQGQPVERPVGDALLITR
ncbi:phosphodiester glycosidase family protein [Solwaraspora sp. WMMB335]|uniref:phosphodiester glycosidase family protein n=1 Tax=Solwaraspora sp. WMMB335 TaxID=3404118 RepID=UPI003B929614